RLPSEPNARSQIYFVLGSKKTDFSPFAPTRYTFPSGDVATYNVPFASNAIACATRSLESNAVEGLPLASKRNTFAGEPPAAYSNPFGSSRSDHKYEASASLSSVNLGANSSLPSLRTATPCAVPFRNSSYVDCNQRRVCSACSGGSAQRSAITQR